jgi:hypothetical protein
MLAASAFALPAAAAETTDGQALASQASAPTYSVQTTPISDILKSARARAVLEKELPGLRPFYGRIGDLTLAEVAQSSHGLVGEAKLKAIQAGFDTIR